MIALISARCADDDVRNCDLNGAIPWYFLKFPSADMARGLKAL
jgi:hypothetical protein